MLININMVGRAQVMLIKTVEAWNGEDWSLSVEVITLKGVSQTM